MSMKMKRIKINDMNSCWVWAGCTVGNGYGRFHLGGARQSAHRVMWTMFNKTIPKGKFILHRCDNPSCVNPNHLFLGDALANIRDMQKKVRKNRPKGSKHWRAGLTEQQAIEIFKSQLSNVLLAKKYRVGVGVISGIKTKRKWKHIHNG